MREYYVYLMTNRKRTLYTCVTNNLVRRVWEHRQKLVGGFTSRYNLTWSDYYEATNDVKSAIAAQKQ